MKNKKLLNLLYDVGVGLGLVLAFVGVFLNIWCSKYLGMSEGITIFQDKTGLKYAGLGTACEVFLLLALILLFAYVIVYALELLKVGKLNYKKIRMYIMLVLLGLCLLVILFSILFCVLTSNEWAKLLGNTPQLVAGVGFYLMLIGSIVAGVCGILSSRK